MYFGHLNRGHFPNKLKSRKPVVVDGRTVLGHYFNYLEVRKQIKKCWLSFVIVKTHWFDDIMMTKMAQFATKNWVELYVNLRLMTKRNSLLFYGFKQFDMFWCLYKFWLVWFVDILAIEMQIAYLKVHILKVEFVEVIVLMLETTGGLVWGHLVENSCLTKLSKLLIFRGRFRHENSLKSKK